MLHSTFPQISHGRQCRAAKAAHYAGPTNPPVALATISCPGGRTGKQQLGADLTIAYGFHNSPFGQVLIMTADHGLCGLAFITQTTSNGDNAALNGVQARSATLADMTRRWPLAQITYNQDRTGLLAKQIFEPRCWHTNSPITLLLLGTEFELTVWQALVTISLGTTVSYGELAKHIGRPGAARAVGSAVGHNPISFLVPCHRVLRKNGALGGYHWGVERKRALLDWEQNVVDNAAQVSKSRGL